LLDDAGDLQKAEASYRAALALNQKSDSVHNNLGYNLLLQARSQEAIEQFRAALKLQPHSQVAQNNLGVALASEPKEAVLHMQSVSDPATAHSNLAAVLMEQGKYSEARSELEKALEYKTDHPAALSNLQLISELDGKPFATPIAVSSRWKRFASGVRKALLGVEEPRRDEAVKTASK
jgi:Flp pilus assembly protein TadD